MTKVADSFKADAVAAGEPEAAGAPELQTYGERGVYVPTGMTAEEIMKGAGVLERDFEVAPFISRAMTRAVLAAIRP